MKKSILNFVFFLAVLIGCEKTQSDLCEGVICDNGGVCQNGACQCPPMWTGPACQQEKVPVKMRVTGVELLDYPQTDTGGAGWDLASGADIYFTIEKNGTLIFTSDWYQNVSAKSWPGAAFEFDDPLATYTIYLWDYDDGFGDDYMGGVSFTPYRQGQKFPASFDLACGSCVVSFRFKAVSYFH